MYEPILHCRRSEEVTAAEYRQTFYVPKEDIPIINRIKKDAEQEDRSISYIILRILREHYLKQDRKRKQ